MVLSNKRKTESPSATSFGGAPIFPVSRFGTNQPTPPLPPPYQHLKQRARKVTGPFSFVVG